jgi:hypothetical protein
MGEQRSTNPREGTKNVHVTKIAAKIELLFVNCKLDFAKNAFFEKKV